MCAPGFPVREITQFDPRVNARNLQADRRSVGREIDPPLTVKILGHANLTMIMSTYSHLVVADTYDAMMRMMSA